MTWSRGDALSAERVTPGYVTAKTQPLAASPPPPAAVYRKMCNETSKHNGHMRFTRHFLAQIP